MIDDAADPDPALPAGLPSLDRALGSPDFPLCRACTPDDDRGYTLRGRDARVDGTIADGPRVRLHDARALTGLDIAGAAMEAGTVTPVGAERRFRAAGVPVTERVVAPRAGPLCFLEWLADDCVLLPLSWSIATTSAPRWRVGDRVLAVGAPPGRLLYVLSAPGDWSVERRSPYGGADPDRAGADNAALAVDVRVRIPAGGSVRLAVAALGPGDREPRLLRMMGRGHMAMPARRAEALRVREQGLAIRTGDPALDEALEWEKARAAGMVGAPLAGRSPAPVGSDRRSPPDAVSDALLFLVVGEHGRGRAALTALGAEVEAETGAAAYLFVAARYLAWTGDLVTVRREWSRIGRAVDVCLERLGSAAGPDEGAGAAAGCGVLALRGMVVVAEEVGDRELADRLRAPVGAPESGESVACWPASEEEGAVVAVVHGLLGAEPDAARGRLVLRPRPAADADGLDVRNLRVGGAGVDLDYRREGRVHRFALRQSRGASPLQVVLEPELTGARVVNARVDGQPAELDPVPADGRLRVPIQLVLDHERRLVVEMAAAAT